MNIQKLISQVRQARKRRVLNSFHQVPRSGVDVKKEEFNDTISLLKSMLKYFKSKQCNIHVSFYGEIFITLVELGYSFEISISNRPQNLNLNNIEAQLSNSSFITVSNNNTVSSLTVSVKTMRKKSQWKYYQAEAFSMDGSALAKNIHKDMTQRVRYYSHIDDVELFLKHATKEDKLAVIHLGGALLGESSMLFHLSKSLKNKIYVRDISISTNKIIINGTFTRDTTTHFYGHKEETFFCTYLYAY